MHAVNGLADQAPLDQVLEDEAPRTKVEEPLKECRASKQSLFREKET